MVTSCLDGAHTSLVSMQTFIMEQPSCFSERMPCTKSTCCHFAHLSLRPFAILPTGCQMSLAMSAMWRAVRNCTFVWLKHQISVNQRKKSFPSSTILSKFKQKFSSILKFKENAILNCILPLRMLPNSSCVLWVKWQMGKVVHKQSGKWAKLLY